MGTEARSQLYRYEFPAQDTKLSVGDTAYDIDELKACGTVREIDAVEGFVVLKRQPAARTVRGLTEMQVLADQVIREAIQAVAEDRLSGRPCLGSALVDRSVPVGITDVVPTGLALDGNVLAVQGPPGSGKTTVGAELIRALLDASKKVGVTANSHAVIGNFLSRIGRPALQRCTEDDQFCGADGVVQASSTGDVVHALAGDCRLVGGTAWMWSDRELAGSVDVLIIDEAGQFSLANALAVSRAATSMVLLGDPQQLAQPARGMHPNGAGVSALGHMLAEHDTLPDDRGVFLDTTWRMHPDITPYVSELAYDGRLRAAPDLKRQAVTAGQLRGSGLRMVNVCSTLATLRPQGRRSTW